MRLAVYEDHSEQFSPLTLLRPVFELRCGHFSLRERLVRQFKPEEWGVFLRPELVDTYAESHSDAHVNDLDWLAEETTLVVNGRLLGGVPNQDLKPGTAAWLGDELAWCCVPAGTRLSSDDPIAALKKVAGNFDSQPASGTMLQRPWDVVNHNLEQLTADFRGRLRENAGEIPDYVGVVGNRDDIFIHKTAEIEPYVVINATHGPVWIESGAKIQAFTRLEGPCYIGQDSQLFRANVREGCSIGPVCRVGGEIEESIIHGYANKYHDGFLGHSYICPWVNLGAVSTNSDLKNDYSAVRVPIGGEIVDSGSTKVGCFIGDHSKTAIGSFFNTGTSVGIMSLILPGGQLLPKHIPSYSRVWKGHLEPLPDRYDSAISTAHYAMGRREQTLTPAMERLLKFVYENTTKERDMALNRWQERNRK